LRDCRRWPGWFRLFIQKLAVTDCKSAAGRCASAEGRLASRVILLPAGDGICRMHALDNATGQIMDYGVVECSNASEQNLHSWMGAMSKDKFVEIPKSFRHEGAPP
jgi:hypothetical protein